MTRLLLTMLLIFGLNQINAQTWAPAGDKIKALWAERIDPANPLPEYPRPQMVRDQWKNLNGLWDYAIREKGGNIPDQFDGKVISTARASASQPVQVAVPDPKLWSTDSPYLYDRTIK